MGQFTHQLLGSLLPSMLHLAGKQTRSNSETGAFGDTVTERGPLSSTPLHHPVVLYGYRPL